MSQAIYRLAGKCTFSLQFTVLYIYVHLNTLKALHRLAQYIICVCKKRQISDCLSVTLCYLELRVHIVKNMQNFHYANIVYTDVFCFINGQFLA